MAGAPAVRSLAAAASLAALAVVLGDLLFPCGSAAGAASETGDAPLGQRSAGGGEASQSGRAPSPGGKGKKSKEAACLLQELPSPVNIMPRMAVDVGTSVRLRYGMWRRRTLRRPEPGHRAEGIRVDFPGPEGGGAAQVGTHYGDYDEYVLRSIVVHAPSEHTFLGRRLPVEVQLWHEPFFHRELSELREQREKIQAELTVFHRKVVDWGKDIQEVQGSINSTNAFPSLRTEEDWVEIVRAKVDRSGREILEASQALRAQAAQIERRMYDLVQQMKRPSSSRIMVLSVLFLASDLRMGQQTQASSFFQWLVPALEVLNGSSSNRTAAAVDADDSLAPEDFEFGLLPYQTPIDIAEGTVRRAFAYEGSRTRPPCSPLVRWFVADEPLVAYGLDLWRLAALASPAVAAAPSSPAACGGGVRCEWDSLGLGPGIWWQGEINNVAQVQPLLPTRDISIVVLSMEPFREPETRLSSDSISTLPWDYIHLYMLVFLACALFMLCATCGMWAQQCLDQ